MLTKRCYEMLDMMTSVKPDEGSYGYSVRQLAKLCGLPFSDALRVAELLEAEGYLTARVINMPHGQSVKESFKLTELGQNYKEVRRHQVLDYIADKWVDVFAGIVALISLIVSICTALSR